MTTQELWVGIGMEILDRDWRLSAQPGLARRYQAVLRCRRIGGIMGLVQLFCIPDSCCPNLQKQASALQSFCRSIPMNPFKLAWTYFRIGMMNELQYRVNFFIQLLQSAVALTTGLIGFALVFGQVNNLAGWSRSELLAVMGVHLLMGGVIRSAIQPNMERLMNDVLNGTLDFALMKPARRSGSDQRARIPLLAVDGCTRRTGCDYCGGGPASGKNGGDTSSSFYCSTDHGCDHVVLRLADRHIHRVLGSASERDRQSL